MEKAGKPKDMPTSTSTIAPSSVATARVVASIIMPVLQIVVG